MSQNQNPRMTSTTPLPTTATGSKGLETDRCGRQNNRVRYDVCQREPRYDPKEVRDAVRILSPFVKLIADTGNPYARTVAHEVCKAFYFLYHPYSRPEEVIGSIDRDANFDRTTQLNTEFGLYIPETGVRKWTSLRHDNNLINFTSCRAPIAGRVQCTGGTCGSCCPVANNRREPKSNNPEPPVAEPPVRVPRSNDRCDFREPTNRCSDRAALGCCPKNRVHRAAGADFRWTDADGDEVFDVKRIRERMSESRHHLEKLVENAREKLSIISEDYSSGATTGGTEAMNDRARSPPEDVSDDGPDERHAAGNDSHQERYRSGERPGPDPLRPPDVDPVEQQLEYYRNMGNMSLPPTAQEHTPQQEPLGTGLDIDDIATSTKLLANAFAKLSVANKEIKRKKEAFKTITKNFLSFCADPADACPDEPEAETALKVLCSDAPNIMKSFDPTESNTNAFRDRDFVRLLPFFQTVHVQLIQIVKSQRDECGINMLDEIMSALNHVGYETGDPRLKNDMVVEHVKLVTRNTWESYFYDLLADRMPDIPERPSVQRPATSVRQRRPQNESQPPSSSRSRNEQSRSLSRSRNEQSRSLSRSRNEQSRSLPRSRNEQSRSLSRSRKERRSSLCCPDESQPPCQPSCNVKPTCPEPSSCPVQPPTPPHAKRTPTRRTPNDESRRRDRSLGCTRENRVTEPEHPCQ